MIFGDFSLKFRDFFSKLSQFSLKIWFSLMFRHLAWILVHWSRLQIDNWQMLRAEIQTNGHKQLGWINRHHWFALAAAPQGAWHPRGLQANAHLEKHLQIARAGVSLALLLGCEFRVVQRRLVVGREKSTKHKHLFDPSAHVMQSERATWPHKSGAHPGGFGRHHHP